MSNHSAEYPNGILDKGTLKSFFAITEAPDGTLSWKPGYERIPDDWYRRPLGPQNEYSPNSFALDLVKIAETVPEAVSVGGNTGTTNSFTGVNLGDITTGAYRTEDLTDPKKFVCFFYQLTLAAVPDFLRSRALGTVLASALSLLHSKIDPYVDPTCAKIGGFFSSPKSPQKDDEVQRTDQVRQLQRRLSCPVPRCGRQCSAAPVAVATNRESLFHRSR